MIKDYEKVVIPEDSHGILRIVVLNFSLYM